MLIATEKKYINCKSIQNCVKSNVCEVRSHALFYINQTVHFRLRRSWHEPDLERSGPNLERRVSEDAPYSKSLTLREEFDTSMPLHEETNSDTESATTPPKLTISSPTAISGNGQ